MRIAITLLAIFMVAAVAFGGYGDGSYKSSGTLSGVTIGMSEADPGEEGTTFSVSARSIAPHDHAIKVTGDYAAGPWSEVGDSVFVVKYFAQTTGSNSISISRDLGITLFQGDTLTVTVTVAPTLAAVPDSSVTLDTVSQQYIIDHGVETWVFAPSWLASSAHSEYPTQIDHDLQDSGDGTLFKYSSISESASSGTGVYYSSTYTRARTSGDEPIPEGGQDAYHFFVWPLDSIPAGCEIVSAKMGGYMIDSDDYSGTGDGVYAVIDTTSADIAALQASSTYDGNPSFIQSTWNAPSVDDTTSYWSKGTMWENGYYHDFGITQFVDIESITADTEYTLDITDLVQMHRELGLGWTPMWLFYQADLTDANVRQYCGPTATAALNPFLVVRAKPNKDYDNPWGDGVIVPISFSSDDQYAGSNIAWADVLDDYGYRHTVFVRGDGLDGVNDDNQLSAAQLDSLDSAGTDIQGHSLYHGDTSDEVDGQTYDPNCGCYSFIANADSLRDDLSHTWLTSITGTTVTGMAWPRHIYNLELWEEARDAGMLWARDGTNEQFGDCTFVADQAGEPTYPRIDGTEVAIYALKLDATGGVSWPSPWDNGASGDEVLTDSATLEDRLRDVIGYATRQGRRAVLLFTHDIRGGNYDGAEGLSAAELDTMLQITERIEGVTWQTMDEVMTKFIAGSVACDPPAGSASETYGHTAADAVWRKVQ